MLAELRTFIAVCRFGTFQAAGDRIGLTQSAVSSQIKRLEELLGFALFDRTGRSAVLNAAGQATLPRAEEIQALCAKLSELPDDAATMGMMRVGAIASVQATLLPRALKMLRDRFQLLRLHVIPGVSIALIDALDAGQVDAAIIVKPPYGVLQEMRWTTLLREPYVLLAHASHGATQEWQQLLQTRPFLRYERSSFGGRMVERFLQREGMSVQEAIELDEIGGLINLVAEGAGVALVPMSQAHLPLPPQVRAVSLGDATFFREIGVLQRRAIRTSALDSPFLECLVASSHGLNESMNVGH